jgi:hypothetical protein
MRGGIKGIEFTLGKKAEDEDRAWDPRIDGFHVHIHLLVFSRWIDSHKLRHEWSDCLKIAWSENGIASGINTKDGLAVCNVKYVTNRKSYSKRTISLEGAINEVAKYITKPGSWLEIPSDQLVEVAVVQRWPRMLDVFGDCKEKPAAIGETDDGSDRSNADAGNIGNDGDGRRRALYLDTPRLSGAKNSRDGPHSLREIGAELIKRGRYDEWKSLFALHVAKVQEFRMQQQVLRYPCARFWTLAGHSWGRSPTARRTNIRLVEAGIEKSRTGVAPWVLDMIEGSEERSRKNAQ